MLAVEQRGIGRALERRADVGRLARPRAVRAPADRPTSLVAADQALGVAAAALGWGGFRRVHVVLLTGLGRGAERVRAAAHARHRCALALQARRTLGSRRFGEGDAAAAGPSSADPSARSPRTFGARATGLCAAGAHAAGAAPARAHGLRGALGAFDRRAARCGDRSGRGDQGCGEEAVCVTHVAHVTTGGEG